ncbi:MAG: NAD kinase [Hyphomicrobiales bacterium]
MPFENLAFIASEAEEAQAAFPGLAESYGNVPEDEADIIVALGGDGFMLQVMHKFVGTGKAIYGMNCGSVGFLMNTFSEDGLKERLGDAVSSTVHPLKMRAKDVRGETHEAIAFNEVSFLRERHQAAKLEIIVDGRVRIQELICDGLIVATPAGSTAYNLSAHGPILPINSPLLALTPISAFRPRRWRGAILPNNAEVKVRILEASKRPVSAVADYAEFRDVSEVNVALDQSFGAELLFDAGHSLEERVISEQFGY